MPRSIGRQYHRVNCKGCLGWGGCIAYSTRGLLCFFDEHAYDDHAFASGSDVYRAGYSISAFDDLAAENETLRVEVERLSERSGSNSRDFLTPIVNGFR